jgi:hypothetical protein
VKESLYCLLVILVCAWTSWTMPHEAHAYVVYSTSDVTPPVGCILPQPQKLFWPVSSLDYFIEPLGVEDPEKGEKVVEWSFASWSNGTDCSQPIFHYRGVVEDPSQGGTMPVVGYDPEAESDNQNLLLWVDEAKDWAHGPGVLGLTTLTYNTCDGEIVDGDIEINAVHFTFSIADEVENEVMDLENTVAHEVGHLLGLDHSNESEATMYHTSPLSEIEKRDPEDDDWQGLCCLYLNPQTHVPEGVCTEPYEPMGSVEEPSPESSGCSTGSPTVPLGIGFWTILLVASPTIRRRLRKPLAFRVR